MRAIAGILIVLAAVIVGLWFLGTTFGLQRGGLPVFLLAAPVVAVLLILIRRRKAI